MKRSREDRLLEQIFDEAQVSALRQSSLEHGLAAIRRRRALRAAAPMLASVLFLALAVSFLLTHQKPVKPVAVQTVSHPQPLAKVKVITDDELFALFPNRSMALIGKPGHQQLLFFDQPRSADATRPSL
jgi:hypothetical protein